MVNDYLVAAYGLAWLIFGVYAWSISHRQARLCRDLAELKKLLQAEGRPNATN